MKKIHVHPNTWAKVDDDDFAALSGYKWYLTRKGYASRNDWRNGHNHSTRMHRSVLGAAPGLIVDHINQDKLDNRKENLRFVTHGENRINSKLNSNNKSGHRNISRFNDSLWILTFSRDKKRTAIYGKTINELVKLRKELIGS